MSEDLFLEKLNWFKQNEKPETVLMIADNQEFIKIIIAWTNVKFKHTENLIGLNSESDNETWEWLWDNTKFSLTELKAKAGVRFTESVLEGKIKPLIGNRVLYPDGTINSFVQRYLRERVLKLFEAKPMRPVKRTGY